MVTDAPVSAVAALQLNPHVLSIGILDSPANVVASLGSLNADNKISSIAFSGGSPAQVPMTFGQYTADGAAIGAFTGSYGLVVSGAPVSMAGSLQGDAKVSSFTVSDNSATVMANLPALAADSKITHIGFIDGGTPSIPTSYADYTAYDVSVLSKFTGSYGLVVSGASVSGATALQNDVHVTGFTITDSPANVSAGLNALNSDSHLTSVALTGDQHMVITYSQLTTDTSALGKLAAGYKLAVTGVPVANAATVAARPDVYSVSVPGFATLDTTTNLPGAGAPTAYTGPVSGVTSEFISVTSDSLNVSVTTDNWFIHSGGGNDAISVHGGKNVLDGGAGSNFLVGGTGTDTFFVDDRNSPVDIWSTVVNFHQGDNATIWGVNDWGFSFGYANNQGAAGYTGLTIHASAPGQATASLTLAGFSTSDLSNGRLSLTFGVDSASGSSYMNIRDVH